MTGQRTPRRSVRQVTAELLLAAGGPQMDLLSVPVTRAGLADAAQPRRSASTRSRPEREHGRNEAAWLMEAHARAFGVLWSANALSNLADGLALVSMPLLAASLTDDPRLVAGLATVYAVVRLLVALPVGVWVDRLDRRSLIVTANLLRGAALLGLALTLQFGLASLVILYAVMAVTATLESMADNAATAMLPSVVARDQFDQANGRVAAAQLVADEFVGPPLGGFVFATAAAAPVFAMGGPLLIKRAEWTPAMQHVRQGFQH